MIAVTQSDYTTFAAARARTILEAAGQEVLVFQANGAGGKAMEVLIDSGSFSGVLDLTTTEWADELCGGVLSAGPARLEAATAAGLPQVVTPGGLDMVNFWAHETIPERHRDRLFHHSHPSVRLMRTTPEENARLGAIVAGKLNAARGPVVMLLPLGGWSELDVPGGPFWWPEADEAFVVALRGELRPGIPVEVMDVDVNHPAFAARAARLLLQLMEPEPI